MTTLANIVLDIKTTNPSIKTNVIANTIATSVTNNTIVNSIKTKLNTSTNPTLTALTQSVNISAASLAVEKKIPPVFAGPITYSNTQQVSVLKGWYIGGDGYIKSTDGINWTKITQTAVYQNAFAYGTNNNNIDIVVAVGTSGATNAYSTDMGNTWIRGNPSKIHGTSSKNVIYTRDPSNVPVWLSVGTQTISAAKSYDGINWASFTALSAQSGNIKDIAYKNNQLMACGDNGILLSTDFGNSWTRVATTTNYREKLAYGEVNGINTWICVGRWPHLISKSTDGVTWTAVSGNAASYVGDTYAVAYGLDANGNKRWVIGGQGSNVMSYTSDFVTFTQCSGISSVASIYYIECGIKTDGTPLWIAGGGGTHNILRSNDGITWTSFTDKTNLITNAAFGVHCAIAKYDKPLYLQYTPGTTKLFASVDGTTTSTPISSPFSVAINQIATNGTMWVAVGEGTNTIAYSINGITWTGLGTSLFSLKGTNIVWNATENKWYANGSGTRTNLTSTNGINWV